ncbi:MAG TPA: hypothetical protein VMQ54_10980, partial [Steroidobacteraceae bacterium]|nr:hypothetical protein [Steroidobacteraceae bacterium]
MLKTGEARIIERHCLGYYRRMCDSHEINWQPPATAAAGAAASVMLIFALAGPCSANPPAPACLEAVAP